MGRKFGFSFSAKRALGISSAKAQISRQIGVPLTQSGRERRLGRMLTGGKCFVATACYQDSEHADVVRLRRFRDEILIQSRFGRYFIAWYAETGPILAEAVLARPWLRPVCRTGISLVAACLRIAHIA
jgi:hypothetical protein